MAVCICICPIYSLMPETDSFAGRAESAFSGVGLHAYNRPADWPRYGEDRERAAEKDCRSA